MLIKELSWIAELHESTIYILLVDAKLFLFILIHAVAVQQMVGWADTVHSFTVLVEAGRRIIRNDP